MSLTTGEEQEEQLPLAVSSPSRLRRLVKYLLPGGLIVGVILHYAEPFPVPDPWLLSLAILFGIQLVIQLIAELWPNGLIVIWECKFSIGKNRQGPGDKKLKAVKPR